MAITEVKVMSVPMDQVNKILSEQIADDYQLYAAPTSMDDNQGMLIVTLYKGTIDGGGSGSVAVDDITDATTVGRSVLTAADAAAARTAIGAGTSNLVIGTTSNTAMAGNYTPPAATTAIAGMVNQAAAVANAAGEAPTAAEYNALLDALRTAGVIATA